MKLIWKTALPFSASKAREEIMWEGQRCDDLRLPAGGARLCRAVELALSLPRQIVDDTLIWPIFRILHKTRPDGIRANIFPLLTVIFVSAEAMMKPT